MRRMRNFRTNASILIFLWAHSDCFARIFKPRRKNKNFKLSNSKNDKFSNIPIFQQLLLRNSNSVHYFLDIFLNFFNIELDFLHKLP